MVGRLSDALPSGWSVKGELSSPGDRRLDGGQLAIVSLAGAQVPTVKSSAAMVAPAWTVLLVARKGDSAPALLDAALSATVDALHNWSMADPVGGRRWEPMILAQMSVPPMQDDALLGLAITFTTSALFRGQP